MALLPSLEVRESKARSLLTGLESHNGAGTPSWYLLFMAKTQTVDLGNNYFNAKNYIFLREGYSSRSKEIPEHSFFFMLGHIFL